MNEQIKELASQAESLTDSMHLDTIMQGKNSNWRDTFCDKFSQLLIEKVCYDIMDVHGASPEHIALVAKHYGVEL